MPSFPTTPTNKTGHNTRVEKDGPVSKLEFTLIIWVPTTRSGTKFCYVRHSPEKRSTLVVVISIRALTGKFPFSELLTSAKFHVHLLWAQLG